MARLNFSARAMAGDDAACLEAMMRDESSDYMKDFLAFREAGSLVRQCAASRQDVFVGLHAGDELAGFFCLRGLDAGYSRPSFGVYVASRFTRRGLARFALEEALGLCGERGISRVMLKVASGNSAARRLYDEAGFVPCGNCADTGHQMMEKVLGDG